MIGIAIVGYGYWGPNLARNFARLPGVQIAAIADPDPVRQAAAARDHPAARVGADVENTIVGAEIDAVVVATPPSHHRTIALAALSANKHVLIEKPFTTSVAAAHEVVAAADAAGCALMVDHTFVYAPAVEVLVSSIQGGDIGDVIYVESTRTNLARFDAAIGVLRDLAIHDFAILDRIFAAVPRIASVRARRPVGDEPEDFAFVALDYAGVPVHLHVDCLSPVKIRRMIVGGARGVVVYDDIEAIEKIRIFQRGRGATLSDLRTGYRDGPVLSPPIPPIEPLARVAVHFVACIRTGATPLTDGRSALRILATTEAAEDAMSPHLNRAMLGR
jgi:predicted dehydrogenase